MSSAVSGAAPRTKASSSTLGNVSRPTLAYTALPVVGWRSCTPSLRKARSCIMSGRPQNCRSTTRDSSPNTMSVPFPGNRARFLRRITYRLSFSASASTSGFVAVLAATSLRTGFSMPPVWSARSLRISSTGILAASGSMPSVTSSSRGPACADGVGATWPPNPTVSRRPPSVTGLAGARAGAGTTTLAGGRASSSDDLGHSQYPTAIAATTHTVAAMITAVRIWRDI